MTIVDFSIAALPAAVYSSLKVGPLGPAGRGRQEGRIGVWCTRRDLGLHERSEPVV